MSVDVERTRNESRGRWHGIYNQLGIDVGIGKHQPCPYCAGTNRFRLTDKDGLGGYFCNQCGAGDGFSLIMKVFGIGFIDAVKKVSDIVGIIEPEFKDYAPKKKPAVALNRLWSVSHNTTVGDPVDLYLKARGIEFIPANIKTCYNCYESDTKSNYVAMIAKIMNKAGKPISIHRTFLEGTKKANIKSPKKLMTATEDIKGGAIQLAYPAFDGGALGVAEGIETALSAMILFKMATWAVISTSLMEAFDPPEEYRNIVIFADNDVNFAGQKAAYNLAKKLNDRGLRVDVIIPPSFGDYNDVLRTRGEKG